MKNWFGKKQLILAGLVLALGAAVYLNYTFADSDLTVAAGGKTTPTSVSDATGERLGESRLVNNTTADYFEAARLSRKKSREDALAILKDLLGDKSKDSKALSELAARVATIAQAVTQEDKIETLVKAKGFPDCVVYIEGENCSVVVKSRKLSEAQTVQILGIVTAQSAVEAKNVAISAVNS